MPVNWTAENDRKLLLNLITTLSTKDINAEALASLFPGATPKPILERVAKLRRELKAANGVAGATAKAATVKPATSTATTVAATNPTATATTTAKAATTTVAAATAATKPATTKPPLTTAAATTAKTATTTARKRGREIEEGDAVEDVVVKKRGRVPGPVRGRKAERVNLMEMEREIRKSVGSGRG